MLVKHLQIRFQLSSLKNKEWKVSSCGKNQESRPNPTKNYEFCDCQIPEMNHLENNEVQTCWRVMKYQNGFLNEHVDEQVHPTHCGTEILLPPKTQCSYEGGELVIKEDSRQKLISPDENDWTYVFMPLGTLHRIEQVQGMRYSFIRRVYGKEKFEYDAPKNIAVSFEV